MLVLSLICCRGALGTTQNHVDSCVRTFSWQKIVHVTKICHFIEVKLLQVMWVHSTVKPG